MLMLVAPRFLILRAPQNVATGLGQGNQYHYLTLDEVWAWSVTRAATTRTAMAVTG